MSVMNPIAPAHTQPSKQQRQAAAYVAMALPVIPLAKSADDLRTWWNQEQQQRDKYGLTETQTQTLIEACKEHVRSLGETRGVQP
ncbi:MULTISPECIES: hypothetical protein [unclassified Bradyrhizobium]|uniref:hypothetical protein n=1 Tax=unclassified Bradyrhizobium TaxID=2631580 RepID=UPI001FF9BC09|nr:MULTISPECIES: hypothetical protein [unclassified Bradyrhizobium]MCK1294557.1 hypothetical protein [Bradyrhizobium sp. 30]MCK1310132.1 hypothetical protein [Bradyrhizobium sp. 45]MCK1315858.1 hypothetical protein [Bradyrhizobium sp. 23]MCK1439910.1 hypothetical protein [Bradyrhizobium sp. 15]MCK1504654.1 hypothetical protein [Bradyrhizobium sp. 18]